MDLNLLEKTELWIGSLRLNNADLNEIARVVAGIVNLPRDKVLVVDVREDHITLDILLQQVKAEHFFGKKKQLLGALGQVAGVEIFPETDIHSAGILGSIALEEGEALTAIQSTEKIREEILAKVRKRVIVFPTGFEVKTGMIKDTNTPFIASEMENRGYRVSVGEVLDDDAALIAGKIRKVIDEGYGLIITTGGVGAENKDKTVEAILKLDREAATPYIIKFEKGTGRHEKDGVRIAVGDVGGSLLVALPGPNDEVKVGLGVLLSALEDQLLKNELANKLAGALRERFKHKFSHLN